MYTVADLLKQEKILSELANATYSIIPNPLPHIKPNHIGSGHGRTYTFNPNSQDDKTVDFSLFNQTQNSNQTPDKLNPSIVVLYKEEKKEKKEDEEEDVSEEFVTTFNAHIGNFENKEKAKRLIEKMKRLGGLIPSEKKENIDIPAARLGLSILAGLNKPTFKMEALDNLLLLLENDKLEKETSVSLVTLAINLMKKMNRELMQTEILDVQIKITEAYSVVAELLQRHYAKKHINAITKELKLELINTTHALKALNTQEDPKLDFYANLALEGVRRLIDDRKELFDLIERFYHAAAAAAAYEGYDAATAFQELAQVFKDLDPHLPQAWYNGVLILKELSKEARKNKDKLTGIQVLIREKFREFDWKYTYAALQILLDISLHGETLDIRKRAFNGVKILGPDYPGLIYFASSKDLSKFFYFAPMIHLNKPRRKDPNIEIRFAAMEYLIQIAKESNDPIIKKKAKLFLILRNRVEKEQIIKDLISPVVPESKEDQIKWLRENDEKPHRVKTIHITKAHPADSKTEIKK